VASAFGPWQGDHGFVPHLISTMQVALAWLLERSPNILLIPGTSASRIFARIFSLRCFRLLLK
jgi:hypothetical protein